MGLGLNPYAQSVDGARMRRLTLILAPLVVLLLTQGIFARGGLAASGLRMPPILEGERPSPASLLLLVAGLTGLSVVGDRRRAPGRRRGLLGGPGSGDPVAGSRVGPGSGREPGPRADSSGPGADEERLRAGREAGREEEPELEVSQGRQRDV